VSSIDQAGDITNMKAPAFESGTLMRVFVPAGSPALCQEFARWAGNVEFSNLSEGCGTVIFSSPNAPWIPRYLEKALRPFFDKGGTECHVFEYDPIRKNFVRRGPAWLDTPGRVVVL